MSDSKWLYKVLLRGGVYEAFRYGLTPSEIEDKESNLYFYAEEAYRSFQESKAAIEYIEQQIDRMLGIE